MSIISVVYIHDHDALSSSAFKTFQSCRHLSGLSTQHVTWEWSLTVA